MTGLSLVKLDSTAAEDAGAVISFPSVQTSGLTGDFNDDFAVDAADYLVWRNQVGDLVEACSGPDANCNGFVDNQDIQYWRTNYGRISSVGAGATGGMTENYVAHVPEPSTLLLFAMLAGFAIRPAFRCRERPVAE
jgi:hypothetical protein